MPPPGMLPPGLFPGLIRPGMRQQPPPAGGTGVIQEPSSQGDAGDKDDGDKKEGNSEENEAAKGKNWCSVLLLVECFCCTCMYSLQ